MSIAIYVSIAIFHVGTIWFFARLNGGSVSPSQWQYYLGNALIGFVLTQALYPAITSGKPFFQSRTVLYVIAIILAGSSIDTALVSLTGNMRPNPTFYNYLRAFLTNIIMASAWMYGLWSAIVYSVDIHQRRVEADKRAYALESAMARAQLKALENQINPHFLFNVLNSVASLILLDRKQDAHRAVVLLGDMLRQNLKARDGALVTLAEEVELAEMYLTIEGLRYPDRLVVDWQIDPKLLDTPIPGHALQGFVENVVKHTVARTDDRVEASIYARRTESGDLEVGVRNSVPASVPDSGVRDVISGTGLANLRKRVEILFAGTAALSAGYDPDGSYDAHLRLPRPVEGC
ncbi:histidine kinase [Maricaulis sp.]|uniref:sensor histidine kinase n=1 Tax=Maricaulis sp. TaxID=1486257 RepID=UPI0026082AB1|nr:histidine kinase [Maricaulis sp.]